jgi:hypothetical protein
MGLTTTSRRSATRRPPRPLPQIDSKSQRPVSDSGETSTSPDASLANAARLLEDRAIALAVDRLLEKKIAALAGLKDGRARALEEKLSLLEERLSRLEARFRGRWHREPRAPAR